MRKILTVNDASKSRKSSETVLTLGQKMLGTKKKFTVGFLAYRTVPSPLPKTPKTLEI